MKSFIIYFQSISNYFFNLFPKIRWSFIFLQSQIISQPIKEFETKKKQQKISFPPLFILRENYFCNSPKFIPGWHFSGWLFSGWLFSGWHFLGGFFPDGIFPVAFFWVAFFHVHKWKVFNWRILINFMTMK